MKKIFMFFYILPGSFFTQVLEWEKVIEKPDAASTHLTDIERSSEGNIYVTGYYKMRNHHEGPQRSDGAFVMKFSPSGQLLWSDTAKGSFAEFNNLALDEYNNISIIGGDYSSQGPDVYLQGYRLPSTFVVRYLASGQLDTILNKGGVEGDLIYSHVDQAYYSTVSWAGIIKYDRNWKELWSHQIGNGVGKRIKQNGNILTVLTNEDIARYDTQGNLLWKKSLFLIAGGSFDLAVDDQLNCYIGDWLEIHQLDAAGEVITSYTTGPERGAQSMVFHNGLLYTNTPGIAEENHLLFTVASSNAQVVWSAPDIDINGPSSNPIKMIVSDNYIYGICNFGDWSNGYLYKMAIPKTIGLWEQELAIPALAAHPNPTEGLVHLDTKNFRAEVFDCSGRLLLKKEITDGCIDLTILSAGVYFVQAHTPTEMRAIKVVRR